jgi:hypothetical protein
MNTEILDSYQNIILIKAIVQRHTEKKAKFQQVFSMIKDSI